MEQILEQTHGENFDKQIVLYNPDQINDNISVNVGKEIVPVSEPKPETDQFAPPLVLPAVGAYTVQCAMCYKWRFIPTKEKYQEIREHIMDQPFTCDLAKEWRNDVSCDIVGDIEQDETRLWVIDYPSIAQPPPGWDREIRIRGEGGSNFADVYYTSPIGKKLRSSVDVHKYLMKHPEFGAQGVRLSQFSFKKPKPLQENYTRRKRAAPLNASFRELVSVNSLPWTSPDVVTQPVKKTAQPAQKHMLTSSSLDTQAHRTYSTSLPPPNGLYDY